MLAEKEALLVAGLDEFGGSELRAQDQVNTDLASRAASGYPYEATLIARMKSGDLSAFDDIVEQFQPMVYMLSLRVLADPEDARDATQESFLKVYRHIGGFRGEASLKTWICRIAINQARSMERWWRRRKRKETCSLDAPLSLNGEDDLTQIDFLSSSSASPEAETLSRERERQLESAISRLKKDFRIAVILRDIEGLSYEEIAWVTGISVGTVKSRIARGREMLREVLT
ncbi:MAG: sigma-70 family RNA polymerase sigma factor [Acidobacteria bacterium]|nr:sigma-70 family RNA polymerase sigma factor [Acidobacteriota bacterium]MBK9707223.1 sigma-70 family RNA polymerase sigma factor [Acidobacteriota bacterium]